MLLAALLLPVTSEASSIAGQVTAPGGAPISGVFLDLFAEDGAWFDYWVTDDTGHYRFDNLGVGVFFLHTDTLGAYVDEWHSDVPGAADGRFYEPPSDATPIPVALNQAVTGIDFVLDPAASLAGRVRQGSSPVTNVYVDAHLPDGARFRSALTREDGTYTIDGLPAGSYAVRTDTLGMWKDAWHDGTDAFDEVAPQDTGVNSISLAAGASVPGVDFNLVAGGMLSGLVQAANGDPVAGVYVDLYGDLGGTGTLLEFDRTDTNGVFVLKGLPGGTYYLGVDTLGSYVDLWYGAGQPVRVHYDQPSLDGAGEVALPDQGDIGSLTFTLDAGAEITGRVQTDAGVPVADAFVDLLLGGLFFDFAMTEADGTFRIAGLPDGTYYLKTYTLGDRLDEWYADRVVIDPENPIADGAEALVISNGVSLAGLVLSLGPGAEIAGAVRHTGGAAIPDAYVDLYLENGRRAFYTESLSNGTFRLGGLPGGTYYLRTDTADRFVDEWHDNRFVLSPTNPAADQARAVVLGDGGATGGVDFVLQRGGSLSGTVSLPPGTSAAEANVEVYVGDRLYRTAGIASNGTYQVSNLPSGSLYVRTDVAGDVVNEWYRDVYIFHSGRPSIDGAVPVDLAPEQDRSGIDFELGLGGNIEGALRTDGGAAVPDQFVDLYDHMGRYYDFALSDALGAYVFELLPPGTWYVATDTFGAFVDQWFDSVPKGVADPIVDGAGALSFTGGVAVVGVDFTLALQPVPLSSVRIEQGGVLVEWEGVPGVSYQVQRRPGSPALPWSNAPSIGETLTNSLIQPAPAGPRRYVDPAPLDPGAWYRVRPEWQ